MCKEKSHVRNVQNKITKYFSLKKRYEIPRIPHSNFRYRQEGNYFTSAHLKVEILRVITMKQDVHDV